MDGNEIIKLAQLIDQVNVERKLVMPQELLGTPSWDIMLALYITKEECGISNIADRIGQKNWISLRWVEVLVSRNYVQKVDKAVTEPFFYISEKGIELVEQILQSVVRVNAGCGE